MADNGNTENHSDTENAGELCTYLLTIRRTRFDLAEAEDFRRYFGFLRAAGCEVLVVDGSPAEIFQSYDEIWRERCRHAAVDPQYRFLNGKVNGIHTGIDLARNERVILADDDIRYTPEDVWRMCNLLAEYEMVRPQNYFLPLPFWARMESARMLINRAFIREGDYTGTLGVTRTAMRRVGHYDGDVLFDNEEIVRHFRLKKAKICYARDFFVLKRPATFRKWIEQRPRQAYEDFIMRAKTAFFLSLPIVFVLFWLFGGLMSALVFVFFVGVGAVLTAALGLNDGATKFFPVSTVFYAPLWFVERSFSTYWAFYWRFTLGGYPFGDKVLSKGTGNSWSAAERAAANDEAV
jgi:hypothetical protein